MVQGYAKVLLVGVEVVLLWAGNLTRVEAEAAHQGTAEVTWTAAFQPVSVSKDLHFQGLMCNIWVVHNHTQRT